MITKQIRSRILFILLFVYGLVAKSYGQDFVLPLYTGEIPISFQTGDKEKVVKRDIVAFSNVQTPDIAVYLHTKRFSTGQAVIICPGGGYWVLAYDLEGSDIDKYLNSIGVAGIVLKYRFSTNGNTAEPHKAPLMDVQRAMRLVKANAASWNIDTTKIGIMGFSAGGHLASTLATHFDYGNKSSQDKIERQSCHPYFMVLKYPVVSLKQPCTHSGYKEVLLGKTTSDELVKYYSNELQVKEDRPPAFLVHANNGDGVLVENSLLFYAAMQIKKIPAELYILSTGGHGFGLGLKDQHVAS